MRRVSFVLAGLAIAVAGARLHSEQRARGAAPTGTGFILGQVVDAAGGQGVSGAVVTIGAPPTAPPSLGELVELGVPPAVVGRRVLTNADGRFLFRDLARGRYAIAVAAPGYVPGNFGQGRPNGPGQAIDLDDGQKLGGVAVRMWKYAAITGAVVDDRGEPAVAVSVRCLRRVIAGGQPRFAAAGVNSPTDDRGVFRAGNLVPGEYVCGTGASQTTMPVSVIDATNAANAAGNLSTSDVGRAMQSSFGRADDTGFRVGDFVVRQAVGGRGFTAPPPAAEARMLTYPTQYFAGSSSISQATRITLKSGEERGGVNLALRLVPAVRVSGTITAPGGPGAFLGVVLLPANADEIVSDNVAEAARTVSDASGRFTFLGIPTGQYVIKIRVNPRAVAAAAAPTNVVEGAPIAAVDIGLAAPGVGTMGGRGGSLPPPPPTEPSLWATQPITVGDTGVSNVAVTLKTGSHLTGRVEFVGSRPQPTADQIQRMTIRLQSAEGRTSSTASADGRAAADGTFRTGRYAGGRYVASVIPATIPPGWSLRSVRANGKDISVDPVELTEDLNGVVMTFTDQTTTLSGTVTNDRNVPDQNVNVVAFPADSEAWKAAGVVFRRWRDERVNQAGAFLIPGLPPGEYYLATIPSNGPGDTRDPKYLESLVRTATRVTLGDGEKKTVDLKVR
jgi:hypothetical protein